MQLRILPFKFLVFHEVRSYSVLRKIREFGELFTVVQGVLAMLCRNFCRGFQKIYKKTHTEYGFPYAEVVKYEVVFGKTAKAVSLYKKKRLREERKAIIAIITIAVLVFTILILDNLGYKDDTIINTSFFILLSGVISCLCINYNANHEKLNPNDYIVLFSKKNYAYLDFPPLKL